MINSHWIGHDRGNTFYWKTGCFYLRPALFPATEPLLEKRRKNTIIIDISKLFEFFFVVMCDVQNDITITKR